MAPDYAQKDSLGLATSVSYLIGCLGKICGCSAMLKIAQYVSRLGYLFYGAAAFIFVGNFFLIYGIKDVITHKDHLDGENTNPDPNQENAEAPPVERKK